MQARQNSRSVLNPKKILTADVERQKIIEIGATEPKLSGEAKRK